MEEIINYKAKKKKLIFKTGILDNFLTHDTYFEESPLRIKILANGFFLQVIIITVAYMIIISLKYYILVMNSFNWMNIHFMRNQIILLDSINDIIIIQFFIILMKI